MSKSPSRRALLAGAAAAIPAAVAIPAVALPGAPDPIFAAIEEHRDTWKRCCLASLALDELQTKVQRDDPQPIALIHWRNYDIGGSELEDMRERLLRAGTNPATVEREYRSARKRYAEKVRRVQEWEERNGLVEAIETSQGLYKAETMAAIALTNVRPTTIAGVIALLAYVDEFNRGGVSVPVPSCYSEHEQWPQDIVADTSVRDPRGEPLNMPWAYWVMRNVQAALQEIRAVQS